MIFVLNAGGVQQISTGQRPVFGESQEPSSPARATHFRTNRRQVHGAFAGEEHGPSHFQHQGPPPLAQERNTTEIVCLFGGHFPRMGQPRPHDWRPATNFRRFDVAGGFS